MRALGKCRFWSPYPSEGWKSDLSEVEARNIVGDQGVIRALLVLAEAYAGQELEEETLETPILANH